MRCSPLRRIDARLLAARGARPAAGRLPVLAGLHRVRLILKLLRLLKVLRRFDGHARG